MSDLRHAGRRLALSAVAVMVCLMAAVGCGRQRKAIRSGSVEPGIKSLMDLRIDPSADGLWGAVGTVETKAGVEIRQPRTNEEWAKLRVLAQTLADGASQLSATRTVGPDGAGLLADASTPGIRTAAQIKADIDRDPGRFSAAAGRLRSAGIQAVAAIDAKDAPALLAAGAQMDAACEACHSAYWYPRTPPLPLPDVATFDGRH